MPLSAETKVEALIFNSLFIAQARIQVNSEYECVDGASRQEVPQVLAKLTDLCEKTSGTAKILFGVFYFYHKEDDGKRLGGH